MGSNPAGRAKLSSVRTGDMVNGPYLRHRQQPRAERVVEGLQSLLFQVEVAEIVMHEAYDPDAVVDLLDADTLTGQHVREVDALAVHADASAGGDHDFAVV